MFGRLVRRVFFAVVAFWAVVCAGAADDPAASLDSENAAYWYERAYEEYEKPEGFDVGDYADGDVELTGEIEMFLLEHGNIVEYIINGSQRKYCDWGYDEFEDVWNDMPSHLDLGKSRAICYLLLADARLKASHSQHEAVLKRWESLIGFASHMDDTQPWLHIIAMATTASVYDNIHKYLNLYPNMPTERLEAIKRLVDHEQELKHYSLKEVLEGFGEFAKVALTEHKEQISVGLIDSSPIERILSMNEEGWVDEFCERNLRFCLEVSKRNIEALKLPYPESWIAIQKIESEFIDYAGIVKYMELGDDFEPTKDDYEDFMKQSGSVFYVLSGPMTGLQLDIEVPCKTIANAVRTALPILLEYRKTKQVAKTLPADGPKDMFSGKVFAIEKTEEGFKLVCRGRDMRKSKRHEYVFVLPK